MLCVVVFLVILKMLFSFFFFFNDTATTEIYTLSLHDALPIWRRDAFHSPRRSGDCLEHRRSDSTGVGRTTVGRSEEHTSELQSQSNLVCRLLLEKKKKNTSAASTKDRPHQPLDSTY